MTDFFADQEQGPVDTHFMDAPPASLPERTIARDTLLTALAAGEEMAARVQNEGRSLGSERTKNDILEAARRDRELYAKETLVEIAANPNYTPEQKKFLAQERAKEIQSLRTPTMMEVVKEKMALQAEAPDHNAVVIQEAIAEQIDAQARAEDEISRLPAILANNDGPIKALLDVTATAVMPGWAINVRDIINEAVPGFISVGSALPFGGIGFDIKRFKDYLASLPPEERLGTQRRLAEAASNNLFLGSNNGWLNQDIYFQLTDDLTDDNFDVWLNNIFGTIEYAGLGLFTTLPRMAAKGLKGLFAGQAAAEVASGVKPRIRIKPAINKVGEGYKPGQKTRVRIQPDIREVKAVSDVEDIVLNPTDQKPVTSVSKQLDKVAPVESKELAAAVLADTTRQLEQAVGATREQVTAEHILFKKEDADITLAPDLNEDGISIFDLNPTLASYTPEEREVFSKGLQNRLDVVTSISPRIQWNKAAVRPVPGGYEASVIVGDSATHGFSSFNMAWETARTIRQNAEGMTNIYVRKPDGTGYMDVSLAKKEDWYNPKKGDFIIEFKVAEQINPSVALETTEPFAKNAYAGKLASSLDPSSVFQGWLNNARNAAIAAESAVNKRLLGVLRPMTQLGDGSQRKIIQALDIGDREQKWYDDEFLHDIWRDEKHVDKLIAGYKAAVRHNRAIYQILNTRIYNMLKAEDVKHVILPKDSELSQKTVLGKVVERRELANYRKAEGDFLGSQITKIYDSQTKTVLDVDTMTLDALAADELTQFVRFKTPIKHGGQTLDYMVIRGDSAKLKPLPKKIIKDVPGYIARIYDAPYILKEVYPELRNGQIGEGVRSVRMYRTLGEAQRDAARMNAELPEDSKTYYKPFEANELREDAEFANRTSLDYFENSGMLFYSERGLEVKGVDGMRRIESVADSLAAMRAKAARAQTLDPHIDKLIANWEKKYGAKYGKAGRMPWDENDVLRHSGEVLDRHDYARAVALHRHIRMIAGVDTSMFTKAMRDTAVKFSDYLSTTWNNTPTQDIAAWTIRNRNRNPVNGAKGANFTSFIIFNPLVQLPLQAMQMSMYLGLDNAMKYTFREGGWRHHGTLLAGSVMKELGIFEKNLDALVVASGMKRDEYIRLVNGYRNAGFPSRIDSHMYAAVSNLDRNMVIDGTGDKLWAFWNQFRRIMRRVGFDAGEHAQISSAWLVERNKWIKQNPSKVNEWDNPINLAEITGRAGAVSGNMDKGGMLQFQKGFLGLMFQFLSHTNKMMQILIPNEKLFNRIPMPKTLTKFSNKAWSDAEKAKMQMIMLGLFGSGGFGANAMLESGVAAAGVEIPEDLMMMAQEGLAGTMFNVAINAAFNEEDDINSDIEFSSRVSPLSGIIGRDGVFGQGNPILHAAMGIFVAPKEAIELIGGPFYTIGTKAGEFYKFSSALVGYNWDVPPGELDPMVGIAMIDEAARQFVPMWNNFIRGRAEDAMDRYISNAGNQGVEITDGEAWGRRYFGLMPRAQRQYQGYLTTLRGLQDNPQAESIKQELNSTAKQYYKFIKRMGEYRNDGKVTGEHVLEQAVLYANSMRQFLEDDEYNYLFNRVREELFNDTTKDATDAAVIKQLMNYYKDAIPNLYDEAQMDKFRNYKDIPGKDEMIQIIEDMK